MVNDGSTDGGGTEEIAKSYGDKIRYLSKKNGGTASALNLGIQKMEGEYFSWLSHDDVYFPDKIEKQIEYLRSQDNKQIITFCDCEIIDGNSQIIRKVKIKPTYLRNIYLTILSTSIGGCSLLIPKICFEKAGLFNEQLPTTQDAEMWLRLALAGFKFEYRPDILLKVRIHETQGSVILRDIHAEEKDSYFIWAFHQIEDKISYLYRDLQKLMLKKRCYKAYLELPKILQTNIFLKNFSMLWHILIVRYRIIKNKMKKTSK